MHGFTLNGFHRGREMKTKTPFRRMKHPVVTSCHRNPGLLVSRQKRAWTPSRGLTAYLRKMCDIKESSLSQWKSCANGIGFRGQGIRASVRDTLDEKCSRVRSSITTSDSHLPGAMAPRFLLKGGDRREKKKGRFSMRPSITQGPVPQR